MPGPKKLLRSSSSVITLASEISSSTTWTRHKMRTGLSRAWTALASSVKSCTWNRSRSRRRCLRIVSESSTTRSSGCKNRLGLPRSTLNSLIRWTLDAMKTMQWWTGIKWTYRTMKITSAKSTMSEETPISRASEAIRTVWWPLTRTSGRTSKIRARTLQTHASNRSTMTRSQRCIVLITRLTTERMPLITRTWTGKTTMLTCCQNINRERLKMSAHVLLTRHESSS